MNGSVRERQAARAGRRAVHARRRTAAADCAGRRVAFRTGRSRSNTGCVVGAVVHARPPLSPPKNERAAVLPPRPVALLGAGEETRTPDPRITNALLYQLSYTGQ